MVTTPRARTIPESNAEYVADMAARMDRIAEVKAAHLVAGE